MHSGEGSGRQKILMVGPCEAGKSTLANVLAENTETASELYRPTVGVRILEFEVEVKSSAQNVTVELWDVAGDMRYRNCWPAVKKDAVGIVLVYNPERAQHEQEIEQWFQAFVKSMNLSPSQVMVIQTLTRPDGPRKLPLPSKISFAGIGPPLVVSADDLVVARRDFEKFLEKVVQSVVEKQRQDEEDVMGQAGNLP
mmetsp:Transcript_30054/g.70050  ORF Transcript_30054/g.70050 Transcript_30054/m.70050 type:complete len:197 (+) Transcript_30054:95-685(+)|eukprot:CAMPEP_0178430896 /NCGR_PEP_ID=MMETSP0689_2-20121128/31557_1 /TAXON_ID=160604 /ORGANISM="Amphidinium massartii, Strain CS-259" /LENGTH=196 /DNA_ID=CAMNT_0020052769 /DNA_START=90 /DNA_END=680 /DNA_ORIENTATION=-